MSWWRLGVDVSRWVKRVGYLVILYYKVECMRSCIDPTHVCLDLMLRGRMMVRGLARLFLVSGLSLFAMQQLCLPNPGVQ